MKFLLVKLVELMIVVAIIGSIGVLGLNMYQDVSGDVNKSPFISFIVHLFII